MERREILDDRHNLGVPSGVSKTISKPMLRSTQTVHLYCVRISTISKWTKFSLEPRHLGVPSGVSKMIWKPMVRSTQSVQLSCIKISTISEWTELSHEPRDQ
jgi:hypothetical protein